MSCDSWNVICVAIVNSIVEFLNNRVIGKVSCLVTGGHVGMGPRGMLKFLFALQRLVDTMASLIRYPPSQSLSIRPSAVKEDRLSIRNNAICSETSPSMNIMTAVVNMNTDMFVKRPWLK